ncbi:hypothetical protein [Spirillospora sp. NPDC047279]|uniref:hypothetical protein n=1 Tax=Spirillospora sp. NPDC047279 TaxID=3155478 RepID=UPI0033EDD723
MNTPDQFPALLSGPEAATAWLEAPSTLLAKCGKAARTWACWNAPMLQFKPIDDCGVPMEVTSTDYDDAARWWL